MNKNYPLISDGHHLYAVVMTVEKRDRLVKDEHREKASALSAFKRRKRAEQEEEKAKEEEEKNKGDETDKTDSKKKRKSELLPKLSREELPGSVIEVEFYHGQQYYAAVFKALRFDLSKKKETKVKAEAPVEEIFEIDYLSMSEDQLFDMPIVSEMYGTFSGFYNIKRCALAL